MVAKLHAIKAELIRQKHEPTALVGKWLRQVTLGYYQYHAIPGNLNRLGVFMHHLRRMWRAVLVRRSQRGQVSWQRHTPLLDRWIPFPRVLHPYPQQRFAARHPR
jgi:RNA-directed DNA polymerase